MTAKGLEGYGWTSTQGPHSCAYIAPRILDLLGGLGIRRVLDLGCGNGALCAEMHRLGFDAVGVEFDHAGVAIARAAYPAIPFYQLGVQDDPARLLAHEARFDAVVSTEVIEHLYAPHQLPKFAKSVLNGNGLLVISTPYHGYLKNLSLAVLGLWDRHFTARWHGGHIKFWSRNTLSELLQESDFDVIAFHGVGRLPYLWKSMVLVARMR